MIRVSEHFISIQGELIRTGKLSVWVRFFGCNLACPGFSQPDPSNRETYIPTFFDREINEYKSLEELPIITRGCDSLYSIDPRFKHLATDYPSEVELVNALEDLLPSKKWIHPLTGNEIDLCFTGGEPLLQQKSISSIIKEIFHRDENNYPENIQFETNGTVSITEKFMYDYCNFSSSTLHFNISPKLFYVSGEPDERAWRPNVIKDIDSRFETGLKFVINSDPRAWDELNRKVNVLRSLGVQAPVFIMPVGSSKEQQQDEDEIGKIATRAVAEGYHISGRLHSIFWGNTVGV